MNPLIKSLSLFLILFSITADKCVDASNMPPDLMEAYSKKELLKSGSNGFVYKMEYNNTQIVVKRSIDNYAHSVTELYNEKDAYDLLNARFDEFFDDEEKEQAIPDFHGCYYRQYENGQSTAIILIENLDYSLFDRRFKTFIRSKSKADRLEMYYRLASKLKFLHKRRLAHCDVKIENMLWSEKKQDFKIVDFGSSVDTNINYCMGGTQGISPPELGKDLNLNFLDRLKYDVFALLVTISDLEDSAGEVYEYIKEEYSSGFINEGDLYKPIINFLRTLGFYLPETHPSYRRYHNYQSKLYLLFREGLNYNPKKRPNLMTVIETLKFLSEEARELDLLVKEYEQSNHLSINLVKTQDPLKTLTEIDKKLI